MDENKANLKMLVISSEGKKEKGQGWGSMQKKLPFYFLNKKLSEANIAQCYYLLSVNGGHMVYNSRHFSVWLAFYNFQELNYINFLAASLTKDKANRD